MTDQPTDPRDLVGRARIRVYSASHHDLVMAEGWVVGYSEAPTLLIRHDDGTQSSWPVTLPREVLTTYADSGEFSAALPAPAQLVDAVHAGGRDDQGEARGYRKAIDELRGVVQRTGSPAAHWAADYLEAVGPDGTRPGGTRVIFNGCDITDMLKPAHEPEHLHRPFSYREPTNHVTLHVTYQGADGLAFVAQPHREATEPYEQYGVVLPWDVVLGLALRMLASHPTAAETGQDGAGVTRGCGEADAGGSGT